KSVRDELAKVLSADEAKIDLAHAALLVAKLDNDEVDVPAYRAELERLGKKLTASLPKDAGEKEKLAALNKFLFEERGYHCSRARIDRRRPQASQQAADRVADAAQPTEPRRHRAGPGRGATLSRCHRGRGPRRRPRSLHAGGALLPGWEEERGAGRRGLAAR